MGSDGVRVDMTLSSAVTVGTGIPREGALDVLKLLFAICVVGLHGNVLRDLDPTLSAVLVEGVFRVAVPGFFLISGVFFARMTGGEARVWLHRLLALYAIWMLVYLGYWFDPGTMTARHLLRMLLVGYHHLWFLPALVMAAAMLHPLRRLSTRQLLTLAGLAYLAGLALQYTGNYHLFGDPVVDKGLNTLWVYRNFVFMGFPFVTLGYLMARHEQAVRLAHGALSRLVLAALAVLVTEAYVNHALTGGTESFDLLVTLPFICPLIVLWARGVAIRSGTRKIAQLSTGIYLIHPLLLDRIRVLTDWPETAQVAMTVALSGLVSHVGLILLQGIAPRRTEGRDRRAYQPPIPMTPQEASR